MNRLLFGLAPFALLTTSASASAGLEGLYCLQEHGNWCGSDGICYGDPQGSLDIRVVGIAPDKAGSQPGILQVCTSRIKCGDPQEVEYIKGTGHQIIAHNIGEAIQIDLQTRFFSYTKFVSAQEIGRVHHIVGHCQRLPIP
jgi:hypothetical protein